MVPYLNPNLLNPHLNPHLLRIQARKKGTYNSDLLLPWEALEPALVHIVQAGGRRANYRFRTFPF